MVELVYTVGELRKNLKKGKEIVNEKYNVIGIVTAINSPKNIKDIFMFEISEFPPSNLQEKRNFYLSTKIISLNNNKIVNILKNIKISTNLIITNITRKLLRTGNTSQPLLTFSTTNDSNFHMLNDNQLSVFFQKRRKFQISNETFNLITSNNVNNNNDNNYDKNEDKIINCGSNKVIEYFNKGINNVLNNDKIGLLLNSSNEYNIRNDIVNIIVQIISYISHGVFLIRLYNHQNTNNNLNNDVNNVNNNNDNNEKIFYLVLSHVKLEKEIEKELKEGTILNLFNCHIIPLDKSHQNETHDRNQDQLIDNFISVLFDRLEDKSCDQFKFLFLPKFVSLFLINFNATLKVF